MKIRLSFLLRFQVLLVGPLANKLGVVVGRVKKLIGPKPRAVVRPAKPSCLLDVIRLAEVVAELIHLAELLGEFPLINDMEVLKESPLALNGEGGHSKPFEDRNSHVWMGVRYPIRQ